MADITVSISDSGSENGFCLIELSVYGKSWKIERSLESFIELHEKLKSSPLINSPLESGSNIKLLEHFLHTVLVTNGENIMFCPLIMAFIDEQEPSKLKNLQVASLMKQYSEVSNERSENASKAQEAWKIIATLAQRTKILETSQQRIHNSFKPKEDGVITVPEVPLLAGVYRFDELMNQAAEVLKDEIDWVFREDGGFKSVASLDVIPVVIPDPPPVVHSYHGSKLLPINLIPSNEESDTKDEVISSVLSMLEPHESQVSYRNSARAFLARVVRRSLGSKIFETGLHALNCFLPDDPIRLTILLGRTNVFVDTWLPTLTEKLSVLADAKGENGNVQMLELMQSSEDDYVAGEDQHPLNEHTVSHINGMSRSGQPSQLFCAFEQMNVEVMSNSLSDLRFLAFIEEVAQLVGKNELFKRSLLLIRGWWTYETSSYINNPTKNFLSDSVLSVLVCSIFNQYHAILFQPLQVLSVFLAEYCELDWRNFTVTIQGIVPFRIIPNHEDTLTETDIDTISPVSSPGLDGEPWLRYPVEADLLNVAMLQKHTDFLKPSACSRDAGRDGTSRVIPGGGVGVQEVPSPQKRSPATSPMVSPSLVYRELEGSILSLNKPVLNDGNCDTDVLSPSPTCDDESLSDVPSGTQGVPVKDAFLRRSMNISNPLNQTNMISSTMTLDLAVNIAKIFEIGAKNLSSTLKAIQEEQSNIELNFNRFFKCVLSRFSNGWRPDVFKNAQSMCLYPSGMGSKWEENMSKGYKVMSHVLPESIWDQVCYMGLVLTGFVSESSVLALSKEILFDRGTLPVGEIGKVLQELTCASSFLGKLKEKFGGLKKFLERFPDEFMICTDHPFNPHVFLKKALTEDEMGNVEKGNVPSHLTAKYKKAQRNKKMKPTSSGPQSPSMAYHLLHTQQGNGGVGPGYNASSQGTNGVSGFRGFNSSMGSNQGSRTGTPRSSFNGGTPVANSQFSLRDQQSQQQNSQYYVQQQQMQHKMHQGQGSQGSQKYPISAPVSSRSRASQSQSILRASASSASNGGNNNQYTSTSPSAFQGNYSMDSSHVASGGQGAYQEGGALGGLWAYRKRNSIPGGSIGQDRTSNGQDRTLNSFGERESLFGGLGGGQGQDQGQGSRGDGVGMNGLSRPLDGQSEGRERIQERRGSIGKSHSNPHVRRESHLGSSHFPGLSPSASSGHTGFDSLGQSPYDSDQRSPYSAVTNGPNASNRRSNESPQLSPAQQYGDLLRSGQREVEPNTTATQQNFDPFQWI
mmetsp:Transcript_12588/g.12221  ORF Transcript_12588/g.12221 Transcript_12588/m.12221 type:complete len:1255 (+) Transcript_12588:255-4019(+)